jgi:prepilin-type N-terminal cleavage/methylation domain-containing protein
VRRDERGFTLIELLVAMTLMVVVLGAVLTTFESFHRQTRDTGLRAESQDAARNAVDRLVRDLRNAVSSGSPVITSVERADPNDLVFQTVGTTAPSGLNTVGLTRVRYCLDDSSPSNGRLWLHTETTTAAALPAAIPGGACGSTTWPQRTVLTEHVTNNHGGAGRPLFSYRFQNGTTSLSDLVAIRPRVFVDVTPGTRAPAEVELSSGVILRNANDAPVAEFSISSQSAKVVLNATAAYDPEGQDLSYEWFLDGAATPFSTESRTMYSGLTVGTVHTFRLKVTDTAGSSRTLDKTVTIR